jgi:ADP-heptose:LPS heptosyltransferase
MLERATPAQQPEHFGLHDGPYALLVPGASALRPGKRWPAEDYARLARWLLDRGVQVAVIGGPGEAGIGAHITAAAPGALDLTGRTDYAQIAGLGARAALAVGNDTGPSHLIAATGAPTLVLFSGESDPALCAPRGRRVELLQCEQLADLPVGAVCEVAQMLLAQP